MSGKYLLVASTAACIGKSATIIGIAKELQSRNIEIGYAKVCRMQPESTGPAGNVATENNDAELIARALDLSGDRAKSPLTHIDELKIANRLTGVDTQDYTAALRAHIDLPGDLIMVEGGADLQEGSLFGLSTAQIATTIDAPVLLVDRYHPLASIDRILSVKRELGDRLLGVVINDVPPDRMAAATDKLMPYLEGAGVPILALMPSSRLLRSVTVRELVRQLHAEVLCRQDRLDLMVESLSIGAMNVSSALDYFRQGTNMAVVTGGDRVEIQLAALETSTQCLILTGHLPPQTFIISRAQDLEIPILSVDLDTLATVEIIDRAFGQVRIQEPMKIECACKLFADGFDFDRLMTLLKSRAGV
jgi:uncharacterized protein